MKEQHLDAKTYYTHFWVENCSGANTDNVKNGYFPTPFERYNQGTESIQV